jgi:hypothetical protein
MCGLVIGLTQDLLERWYRVSANPTRTWWRYLLICLEKCTFVFTVWSIGARTRISFSRQMMGAIRTHKLTARESCDFLVRGSPHISLRASKSRTQCSKYEFYWFQSTIAFFLLRSLLPDEYRGFFPRGQSPVGAWRWPLTPSSADVKNE